MLKRLAKNLLLLFLTVFLVLLALELAVRWLVPDLKDLLVPHREIAESPLDFRPDRNGQKGSSQFDPYLGWTNRPGASGTAYGPDGLVSPISINSLGLRDREVDYSRPAGLKRILVLGDSFAWGYGLKTEERFSDILDAQFPGIQVLNLGVVGYSTDQESVLLEREGFKYDPDMVILLVHDTDIFHNGLRANYGKKKPYYRMIDGELTRQGVPVPPPDEGKESEAVRSKDDEKSRSFWHSVKKDLLGRSRLYRLISSRLKRIGAFRSLLIDLKLVQKDRSVADNVRLTAAIIERMARQARESGVEDFLVLLVPSKEVINYHLPAAVGNRLIRFKDTEILRREEAVERLTGLLKKNSISYIDLSPDFKNRASRGTDLYFINDNHWNARANQIAAEKIQTSLHKKEYN